MRSVTLPLPNQLNALLFTTITMHRNTAPSWCLPLFQYRHCISLWYSLCISSLLKVQILQKGRWVFASIFTSSTRQGAPCRGLSGESGDYNYYQRHLPSKNYNYITPPPIQKITITTWGICDKGCKSLLTFSNSELTQLTQLDVMNFSTVVIREAIL